MSKENVVTAIWKEEPGVEPYSCKEAYCHGYPVASELMMLSDYPRMLYLLFKGELPSTSQCVLLNAILIALANPGPRDPSIHAAMASGVGGSVPASALIAALAVGSGSVQGSRELYWCMIAIEGMAQSSASSWHTKLSTLNYPDDTYPEPGEYLPGFHPYNLTTEEFYAEILANLSKVSEPGSFISQLYKERQALESLSGKGVSFMLIVACALMDLGFNPVQGEMFTLLARLPGAAVHSMEQIKSGYKNFPFYPLTIQNDPVKKEVL